MKQTIIKRHPQTASHILSDTLHPILNRVYLNRGVQSVNDIETELSQLLPFHDLMGIDNAVDCLVKHVQNQSKILIVGDFDADGATSTALTMSALKAMGAKNVFYLVPNRFEYGYGLTPEIVMEAAKQNPDLIITVDNGIASLEGVNKANELGIEVLITDHHLAGDSLPNARAIVNPNQPGDDFASKNLAGVGVVFYVMIALRAKLRELDWFKRQSIPMPNMGEFLDLVALGTVADVVVLDKNNRILVQQGLQRIRRGLCRPGILALLKIASRTPQRLVASDLGFAIGPRLNAAGRLDDMSIGIECLLANSIDAAMPLATLLDELNQERKTIEAEMKQQAQTALAKLHLEQQSLPAGLCIFDKEWHQGVIGILASRIKDQWHRPVIAFALVNDDEIKGSARSISGIHIRDVLDKMAKRHPEMLAKFGGHAMAAGLTIKRSDFDKFSKIFADTIADEIGGKSVSHEVMTDGELTSEDFSIDLANLLKQAQPWGQAFPEPLFDGRFQVLNQRLVGQNHLKLVLQQQDTMLDAIAFNIDLKQWPNHRCEQVICTYRLDVNEFRGKRSLQLIVEHLEAVS